jgi:hypothetical protein
MLHCSIHRQREPNVTSTLSRYFTAVASAALLFHAAAARLPSRSLRDFLSAALKILVTAAVQADPAARAHLYGPRLRLARH